MKVINLSQFFALENKSEYRNSKRLEDSDLVANFFTQCCKNLLSFDQWNRMNFVYPISKISITDKYGFNINRTAIVGDIINVEYHLSSNFDTNLLLKIDHIKQLKQNDEEIFELILKVDQKPNLGRFYSYFNYQTNCKIKLRRMMNTVTIEAKINLTNYPNPYMEENNNMVAQFPWDRLIKNALSKL